MTNLIFGGSNGIGRVCLEEIAKGDYTNVINVDLCLPNDNKIKTFTGDLRNHGFQEKLLNDLLRIQELDSIIWSLRYRNKKQISISDQIKNELEVVLYPLIKIIERLSKKIEECSTSIIVLSSINSDLVCNQPYSYHIGKSALDAYCRKLAVEIGSKSNARVSIVKPGIVQMKSGTQEKNSNDEYQKACEASIPRLEPVNVKEVANVVRFLASEESKAINGASIVVDGGESLLDQYYVARRATL